MQLADDACVVKIRFTFTFAVIVPRGSSYATLAEKVGEKLSVPADAVILRCDGRSRSGLRSSSGKELISPASFSSSSEATEEDVIDGGTDMEAVWRRASGRCITLWCRLAEASDLC